MKVSNNPESRVLYKSKRGREVVAYAVFVFNGTRSMEEVLQRAMGALSLHDQAIKDKQREAIQHICKKEDTFCVLPTGYGKSLIFGLLPLVTDMVYILHFSRRNKVLPHYEFNCNCNSFSNSSQFCTIFQNFNSVIDHVHYI